MAHGPPAESWAAQEPNLNPDLTSLCRASVPAHRFLDPEPIRRAWSVTERHTLSN
jgi:hypothetical protein